MAVKGGKWTHLKKVYPQLPAEAMEGGLEYQARVNATKDQYKDRTATALAAEWKKLRREEDALEDYAKLVRLKLRAVEQLMQNAYEAEDISNLAFGDGGQAPGPASTIVECPHCKEKHAVPGIIVEFPAIQPGGSAGMSWEPHAVVKDKEKYRQWCIDKGLAPSMHLAWSTTNSMLKEHLEDGKDVPPGIEVYMKPKFTLRS